MKFQRRKYTNLIPPLEDNIFDFIKTIDQRMPKPSKNFQTG